MLVWMKLLCLSWFFVRQLLLHTMVWYALEFVRWQQALGIHPHYSGLPNKLFLMSMTGVDFIAMTTRQSPCFCNLSTAC